MGLRQCFRNKPQLSQQDKDHLKRKQTEYCIEGYHSFKSIEHEGLLNSLQTAVDLGAKYGKFDVFDILVKRKTISREADLLAVTVKAQLTERLKTAHMMEQCHCALTCTQMRVCCMKRVCGT